MTESHLQNLKEEVTNLILCNLEDYEPCENVVDFQNETFKVFETISEMVERWDKFAEEYRDVTQEKDDWDRADDIYESEVGKWNEQKKT